MVSYRIITLLALAATGVIAAPCEAGNGNAAAGTGIAAANNAQATGAAGNAQGGADGNAMGGGAGGNAQGGAGGNAQATGAAGNAQQGGAGGNAQGGNAQGGAAGGACPPVTTNEAQGPDNVGVDGAQFVTGQCTSDANCASGCCVQGGGNDPNLAVCRNEPALSPDESCGFTCN